MEFEGAGMHMVLVMFVAMCSAARGIVARRGSRAGPHVETKP